VKNLCGNGAEVSAKVSGIERKWIAEVNPPYPPSVYFRKHHLEVVNESNHNEREKV